MFGKNNLNEFFTFHLGFFPEDTAVTYISSPHLITRRGLKLPNILGVLNITPL